MIYDIPNALMEMCPGAEWVLTGSGYDGLVWHDGHGYDKPTATALQAKIDELNGAEPMRLLRVERDKRLAACDWRASSDVTLSSEWRTYRQALRDLPSTASPTLDGSGGPEGPGITNVTWPTEPS